MTLDRRELLKRLAVLQAATSIPLLQSCSTDEPTPDGAPFSVWKIIRAAVRGSPDQLAARAESVASAGDITAIFAFVRDEIALRPWSRPTYSVQIQSAGYAGLRGVLRSGIGTAREKTELLKSLFERAGFEAEIVDGDIDFDALGGVELFSNARPSFKPTAEFDTIDRWLAELNAGPSDDFGTIDTTSDEADRLGTRLLEAIPTEARGGDTDWSQLTQWLPLLRVTDTSGTYYANPNVSNAVLGEHYCLREPRPSPRQAPIPTPRLGLTLSITRQRAPSRLEPVLTGSWAVGDLIGRRVQLRFLPTQEAADLMSMPLAQLRTLMPTFMVAGKDLTEDDASRLGISGDPFTLDGDVILSDDAGELNVGGRPRRLGNADPMLAASVDSIDLSVNTSEYPRVRVEAGLFDAAGAAVAGLPAESFALHHANAPTTAFLQQNLPEPPRIAFALDFSTSLPDGFRRAELAALVERIGTAVTTSDAAFRAGAFSGGPIGSAIDWFGGWQKEAGDVARTIRENAADASDASSYFKSLAEATQSDANLVVLITDADGSGNETVEYTELISTGCPAVIIALPSALSRDEHFQRLAELSGGHLFYANELDQAVASIVELARANTERPYVFDFVANDTDQTSAPLRLTLPLSGRFAEVDVQTQDDIVAAGRAISGVFLSIELGNRRVVRRLAGYPVVSSSVQPLSDEHLLDARLCLLGRHDLSVEAAAPTTGAALDDVLSAHLSCQGLVEAAATGNEDRIIAASGSGFETLPSAWLALNTPLPQQGDADSVSFQSGYRMILFSDVPTSDGTYRRKTDILPFTDWRTIAPRGDEFARTLRHSLQLTLIEAANAQRSTISEIGNDALSLLPAFQMSGWANRIESTDKKKWQIAVADYGSPRLQRQLLLPEAPSRGGYWSINIETGDVLGHLLDSTGGATVEDTNRKFEMLARVIEAYNEVLQALVAAPPGFSAWVQLEKAKLEHLRRATIAIILMDGTYTSGYGELLEEQVEGWISDKVRSTINAGLGSRIPGYAGFQEAMGWHNRVQALWETATSDR